MNALELAIKEIANISKEIKKYSNDPKNLCSSYAATLLERISWELHKQAEELKEINYYCVV